MKIGMETAELVKDGEKAIPSPPPECWHPPSLLKPVIQIKFAPLRGQQIADFFSLTPSKISLKMKWNSTENGGIGSISSG